MTDRTQSRANAVAAARAAADKQAADVRVLDVHGLLVITDFFVICSGHTDRQVKAIAESVEAALAESGRKPLRREGERDRRWVLLDFVDVVVHVFLEADRAFYELERLWKDAPVVDWEPAASAASKRAEA